MSFSSFLRRVRPLGALVLAATALASCLAIVSGEVRGVQCTDNTEGTCPPGQTCNLATQACVERCSDETCAARGGSCSEDRTQCVVAIKEEDVQPPPDDTGSSGNPLPDSGMPDVIPTADADSGPGYTPCNSNNQCPSKICASNAIIQEAPLGITFCSKTCCSSADCAATEVCINGRVSGRYCAPASVLGRAKLGSKIGGSSCNSNVDCRSGQCLEKVCADACCSESNCASAAGVACTRTEVPPTGSNRFAFLCAKTPGSGATGGACGDVSECKSQLCIGSAGNATCRAQCCSTTNNCANNTVCSYTSFNGTISYCQTAAGRKAIDATCNGDAECASGVCDGTCSAVCCNDSDCPGGKKCRPRETGEPLLRCTL
jgi:hypothetical protein